MLRLETQPETVSIDAPALSGNRAVEEVAGVELDPGLGGADAQGAAALRALELCRGQETGATTAVEHPVVIIASPITELRVGLLDARADRRGAAEIERRARHGRDLPGGDQRRIDRGVRRREQRQPVIEDVPARRAAQIPVGML